MDRGKRIFSPATLSPNTRLYSPILPIAIAGLSNALRRVGCTLGRRAATITSLVLAALLVVPMPATSQVQGGCIGACPVFSSTSLTFDISENEVSGVEIAIMPTATDADQDDERLVYSLWDRDDPIVNGDRNEAGFGDGDAAAFHLKLTYDHQDGKIKFALETSAAYDFETKRVYEFRLIACDDDYNRAYFDITVRIEDEDEPPEPPAAPMVQGASTTNLLVRWNPPADNAGRPDITDYDLQFRENGTSDAWRPWPHSGTETTTVISSGLQAGTQYEVQVLARNSEGASDWSEPGIGSPYATARDPVFLEFSPTRSFKENRGDAVTVTRMNVGDPVTAAGEGSLTYSLENTDTVAAGRAVSFDIVPSSGQIRTKSGENYDYEAYETRGRPYEVTVTATDPHGNSASITVGISVEDVDEPPLAPAAPSVASGPNPDSDTSLSVNWSAPENAGRPHITDYDVQYRKGTSGNWTPKSHTGTDTSTTITGLEAGERYQVQVLARNDEGDSPWSQPGSGRTNVAGNDVPEFTGSFDFNFPENTPSDQDVGSPVTATDDDNDTLTYTLLGPDVASFLIDSSDGQIRTRGGVTYDFEAKFSYSVMVMAADPDDASASVDVIITLTDVPEPPDAPAAPRVTGHSAGSLSVSWNAPANTGRPPIDDYDLRYRECPGDQCPPQPETGWMDGPEGVDGTSDIIEGLSENRKYQVQVMARNNEGTSDWSPPGSGRTLAAPTFDNSSAIREVAENTEPGENVGTPVRATYAGDELTYSLEGIDEASFDIDSSTGQLKTKTGVTYDHETKSSYMVTVKASDASNASATIAVTINITDVDEPPLAPGTPDVIGASTTSLSVTWDPPTDNTGRPDITGYDVQYRQGIRGNWRDVPQEDVSGTSATITGLNEGTLYQVQVRAINNEGSGPYSQPGAGSTNMENPDNNNRAPEFGSEMTTRSFPENTPPNQSIGTPVEASDADVTDPNKDDTLTYSLSGTDAASFNIDFDTGQLRTRSGVTYDYETKNEYSVKVTVTDSSNDRDTIDVTINVTNVDEGGGGPVGNRRPTRSPSDEDGESTIDEKPPPVVNQEPTFPSPSATRSFAENTPPGRNVGAPVTATDAEGHTLTYILDGPDAAAFDIDDSTGQIKTKSGVSYDYEVKFSYAVTVTATDPDNASASIPVTINVEDVDEKPAHPGCPDGERARRLQNEPAGELDGAGPERRPAAHGLRVAIPAGDKRRLASVAAQRHRHHHDDYGAQCGHRLSGPRAGAGRAAERLVAAGKRADE